MQLQHAYHLDVNQTQFSCQNKNEVDRTFSYLKNKPFIVQINYLSNLFKWNPCKYYRSTLFQ